MCHMTHHPSDRLYSVKTWMVIQGRRGVKWRSAPRLSWVSGKDAHHDDPVLVATSQQQQLRWKRARASIDRNASKLLVGHLRHGVIDLWMRTVRLEHKSNMRLWHEAILKYDGNSKRYVLYKLKALDEFTPGLPKIQRHREEKYTEIQVCTGCMHVRHASCYGDGVSTLTKITDPRERKQLQTM